MVNQQPIAKPTSFMSLGFLVNSQSVNPAIVFLFRNLAGINEEISSTDSCVVHPLFTCPSGQFLVRSVPWTTNSDVDSCWMFGDKSTSCSTNSFRDIVCFTCFGWLCSLSWENSDCCRNIQVVHHQGSIINHELLNHHYGVGWRILSRSTWFYAFLLGIVEAREFWYPEANHGIVPA